MKVQRSLPTDIEELGNYHELWNLNDHTEDTFNGKGTQTNI